MASNRDSADWRPSTTTKINILWEKANRNKEKKKKKNQSLRVKINYSCRNAEHSNSPRSNQHPTVKVLTFCEKSFDYNKWTQPFSPLVIPPKKPSSPGAAQAILNDFEQSTSCNSANMSSWIVHITPKDKDIMLNLNTSIQPSRWVKTIRYAEWNNGNRKANMMTQTTRKIL